MKEYRYSLDRGSHKDICPECGQRRFVRYVDLELETYLPEEYGRCDREDSCEYHLNPYKDRYIPEDSIKEKRTYIDQRSNQEHIPIPYDVLRETLSDYEENDFIQTLLNTVDYPFEKESIEDVISMYYIGTVPHELSGGTTFPYIDRNDNVGAIQVKYFDENNSTINQNWLHSLFEKYHKENDKPYPEWLQSYKNNSKTVTCLFGEHLLKRYPNNPIALVEAPKTAIYGTLYFGPPNSDDDFIWMATFNSSLNIDRCRVLQERKVVLFPDTSEGGKTYSKWKNNARKIELNFPGTTMIVSDVLERNTTKSEKHDGYDLADYLIKHDWREYREAS